MRRHNLITNEEVQEIKCKSTDLEKIDHLVHVLPRKGKFAYPKFIECLESEDKHLGHPELAVKLKETVAKLQRPQFFQSAVDTGCKTNKVCIYVYTVYIVCHKSNSFKTYMVVADHMWL